MAWCSSCERYLTPATLTAESSCPSCGAEVEHPPQHHSSEGGSADAAAGRIPWHFWLLLAATAAYLGWRVVQGVALLLILPGMALLS